MKLRPRVSMTLIELLIGVAMIGMLILGIGAMETYARVQLLSSDRRAQLQNELSFVLADMSNNIVRATGFIGDPGIIDTGTGFLRVRVDNDNTPGILGDDESICYRRSGYRIQKSNDAGLTCDDPSWEDLVTRDIILDGTAPDPEGFDFQVLDNGTGVDITLHSRFDPDPSHPQSLSNPELDMRIRVYSRSASGSM